MSKEKILSGLAEKFTADDHPLKAVFVETSQVKDGVTCEVYYFDKSGERDIAKDLALGTVKKGVKTPLQKVLNGTQTLEGYVSGVGTLTVTDEDNKTQVYSFNDDSNSGEYLWVKVGQTMQWEATDSDLVFYEVCYPPYQDGRFQNLPE